MNELQCDEQVFFIATSNRAFLGAALAANSSWSCFPSNILDSEYTALQSRDVVDLIAETCTSTRSIFITTDNIRMNEHSMFHTSSFWLSRVLFLICWYHL